MELAGAIIELARITLRNDFRHIHPEAARVVLIEAGPKVLANFKPNMSAYAEKALKEADQRKDQPEYEIGSDYLCRSHFRIIQQ